MAASQDDFSEDDDSFEPHPARRTGSTKLKRSLVAKKNSIASGKTAEREVDARASKRRRARVWSENDELTLLYGLREYKSVYPNKEICFHSYIKRRLSFESSVKQLSDKLWRLKKRYEEAGSDQCVDDSHQGRLLEVSAKIWGGNHDSIGGEGKMKSQTRPSSPMKPKPRRLGRGKSPKCLLHPDEIDKLLLQFSYMGAKHGAKSAEPNHSGCQSKDQPFSACEASVRKRKKSPSGKSVPKVIRLSPYFQHSLAQQPVLRNCAKSAVKVSPYFQKVSKESRDGAGEEQPRKRKSSKICAKTSLSASQKRDEAYLRKSEDDTWIPPRSEHGLLQEDHFHDPWRVLVICMLLNRTTGLQARRVISDLFSLCPTAEAAIKVTSDQISSIIQPLGLQNKRAVAIQRLSEDYLGESWTHVTQLHGVGKYGADAYAIFCTGKWERVNPADHMLTYYWEFLKNTATG